MSLLKLKTEGQNIQTGNLTAKNKLLANPGLASSRFKQPDPVSLIVQSVKYGIFMVEVMFSNPLQARNFFMFFIVVALMLLDEVTG